MAAGRGIILSRRPGGSGGGGAPSGPAGGSLSGSYPNPTLAADSVGSTQIAANAVGSSELADDAVDTNAIQNNAVTAAKVAADVATQAELDAVSTVANGAIAKSIVDAKGDLIVATAADTVARKAVGTTNGMVLSAQSGQSDGLLWALPPGFELSYVENTSAVTISSTTEATPDTVVTAADLTVDGSTVLLVEFYCRSLTSPTTSGGASILNLHASTNGGGAYSDIGRIAGVGNNAATASTSSAPVYVARRVTPAAGTVRYRVVAWTTSTNGAPTVQSGAGGSATGMPIFIRVTKV